MLTPDMKFPQTFDVASDNSSFGTTVAVIQGTCGSWGSRLYYGVTMLNRDEPVDGIAAVWDAYGKCLYTTASGNTDKARTDRSLKRRPSDAQKLYEKLDADGKALARLVGDTSLALLATYIKDKLSSKVDVNLAEQVWSYGQSVEWK